LIVKKIRISFSNLLIFISIEFSKNSFIKSPKQIKLSNIFKLIMARITVEDCVEVIPNRFELCLIAGNRAKSILSGAPTNLDRKEKPAVIALREIAEGLLDIEVQKRNIIKSIKNRGIVEIVSDDNQVVEAIYEESEGDEAESNINLKDGTFLDENVEVDD
jgi:DNA-directed RNA polymerase subunit omega